MQINKTPQITFGIKHSPLLGQLKPVELIRQPEKQVTQRTTTRTPERNESRTIESRLVQTNINETIEPRDIDTDTVTYEEHDDYGSNSEIYSRNHVTQVRHESDVRSATVTPEPINETLTQEIVWIPEKPVRRGSYTIDTVPVHDEFNESYYNKQLIPVENGVIRKAESGERGGVCTEERSSEVIKRDGYSHNVDRHVKNASAHEKSQAATEEIRTGTDVKYLPNGGVAKTTTTTTVRKVGTEARTANASSTTTRTTTAVTSRDVGVK